MEFHEKLQALRHQKGLTQEELAQVLYVSRTAVSKWEAGRGYPNIDSLKAISRFYGVTIDDLLSGDELLTLAEEDSKQKEAHTRDLVYGLLDLSSAMFFFLPFFANKADGVIQEVSLLSLTAIAPYLRIAYFALVVGMIGMGILILALQNCRQVFWTRNKHRISMLLNAAAALLFTISLQPYAAVLVAVFLAVKGFLLPKKP